MADRIRLRQICMVVDRLEPVLDRLIAVLGLTVCHGKGDLSAYGVAYHEPPAFQAAFFAKHGITGALLPVGDTFLELIAPLRSDVPAARYLERRGPGGYMVITEVESTEPFKRRAAALDARIAGAADYPTYDEIQIDPRDLGGAILSFAMQREGRPFDGGWFPAGRDWTARAAPGWTGIANAILAVNEPDTVAQRWSALIGRDATGARAAPAIELDKGTIRFESGTGKDRLAAIGVAGAAYRGALERARADERSHDGRAIRIAGLEFREAMQCS